MLLFRYQRFPGAERRRQRKGTSKDAKGRRQRREKEKRRKPLARISCLKSFGGRWHVKLEHFALSTWLHIKRNKETFFFLSFPVKINGTGANRGPQITQITLSARFQNLLGFLAVWLKFVFMSQLQLSNYSVPTYQKVNSEKIYIFQPKTLIKKKKQQSTTSKEIFERIRGSISLYSI